MAAQVIITMTYCHRTKSVNYFVSGMSVTFINICPNRQRVSFATKSQNMLTGLPLTNSEGPE